MIWAQMYSVFIEVVLIVPSEVPNADANDQ